MGAGSGSGCPLPDQIRSLPLLADVSTHHSLERWHDASMNPKGTTLLLAVLLGVTETASGGW